VICSCCATFVIVVGQLKYGQSVPWEVYYRSIVRRIGFRRPMLVRPFFAVVGRSRRLLKLLVRVFGVQFWPIRVVWAPGLSSLFSLWCSDPRNNTG
jgi:hypothetical protein